LLRLLADSPKVSGESRIYIHGEKEFECTAEYRKKGIPILVPVVEDLKSRGEELGLPFDIEPVGSVESMVDGAE
jgi:L-2-hydroxycarboxylate dehydrogenase (NAD+)